VVIYNGRFWKWLELEGLHVLEWEDDVDPFVASARNCQELKDEAAAASAAAGGLRPPVQVAFEERFALGSRRIPNDRIRLAITTAEYVEWRRRRRNSRWKKRLDGGGFRPTTS